MKNKKESDEASTDWYNNNAVLLYYYLLKFDFILLFCFVLLILVYLEFHTYLYLSLRFQIPNLMSLTQHLIATGSVFQDRRTGRLKLGIWILENAWKHWPATPMRFCAVICSSFCSKFCCFLWLWPLFMFIAETNVQPSTRWWTLNFSCSGGYKEIWSAGRVGVWRLHHQGVGPGCRGMHSRVWRPHGHSF